ncbi:cytochrome c peroxidase [Halobacteriovorax sp. HFRX-2_2]|uniref:cytochrome-c peroxidase n=1 Tax=unclassified Halobacteriovorax TaxID=2639665 RepID=UPI003710B500
MKQILFLSIFIITSCTSTNPVSDLFGTSLNSIKYFGEQRPKEEVITLGQKLFYDTRLSRDGTVSCSRCHLPQLHFSDGLKKSKGTKDRSAPRNAQTLINTAGQISQHWDGNRKDVEEQAIKSFFIKVPFNLDNEEHLKEKLVSNNYAQDFSKAFAINIKKEDAKKLAQLSAQAIGAFERTLVGPSRFDDYLDGDVQRLTTKEARGLKKFVEYGCIGCHSGQLIGGEMYQKFGVVEDPYQYTKSIKRDLGRYNFTKNEDDKEYFKVPPLRNVTKTAPYFHDGSVASLDQAINIMGKVQLGIEIEKQDREDIMAFLSTLETKEEVMRELTKIPSLP